MASIVEKYDNAYRIDEYFSYYCKEKKLQQGIIRTNCLDSLDRTNSLQAAVGSKVLLMQISNKPEILTKLKESSMFTKFKILWADNGNALSIQYSGTESTTAALTKDGKEGFMQTIQRGVTSFKRFIVNKFADKFKQKCIDVLLNRTPVFFEGSI